MNTLQAGAPAPSFSLPNEQGDMINLADLAGKKVLLYFYPKAMTPGCTVQAQCLRDTQSEFTDRNVVVFGISPDAVKRLPKFIEKENLKKLYKDLAVEGVHDNGEDIYLSDGVYLTKKGEMYCDD